LWQCAPAAHRRDAATSEALTILDTTAVDREKPSCLRCTFKEPAMINRRQYMEMTLGAGAALALNPQALLAAQASILQRAIPSSGQRLPVIGLGSSASFSQVARSEDVQQLREVMRTLVDHGGSVFDTAPSYGASEEVAGRIARELGISRRIFWATKVNVAGRGGGKADAAAARAQIETSFRHLGVDTIDAIQVHNLGDMATQYPILKELKAAGRVRYIGATTTSPQQYPLLEQTMRTESLDFIGIDYAIDNRDVEQTVLPLAQLRKVAVMVYVPFGRTSLFRRVGNRPVPEWAAEFDAKTWAQFFLKYVVSHPAVTVVTPATSQPRNMLDNLAGGSGRLPNEAMRRRMAEFIDALPAA
jgi:aryl-alcohol dehydrogenase-like predicted oxidoreductase